MYLFQSWEESIFYLRPSKFRDLFVSSLKIIYRSIEGFVVIFLALAIFGFYVPYLGRILFYFLVVLSRYSIRLLNSKRQLKDPELHFLYWLFLYPLFIVALAYIAGVIKLSFVVAFVSELFPIEVLVILFWIDADASIKELLLSFVRAIVFFFFNLPFFVVCFFVPLYLYSLIAAYIPFFIIYFFMIIYIAFLANYYEKRLPAVEKPY